MLRELISILRTKDPLQAVGENFAQMLQLTYEMTHVAGDIYFGKKCDPADRSQIYRQDVEVNQLERTIRKHVVAHLSLHQSSPDVPYCLLLMSLVKDVERLGDYAKNLTEVQDICSVPLPDDEIKQASGDSVRHRKGLSIHGGRPSIIGPGKSAAIHKGRSQHRAPL